MNRQVDPTVLVLTTPRRCLAVLAAIAPLAGGCTSIPQGRSGIDSVVIEGAHALDPNDVADKLATAPTTKFLGLFRGIVYDYEVYDPSVLQRDLARVERFYRGKGFLEAHARAGRVSRSARGTSGSRSSSRRGRRR